MTDRGAGRALLITLMLAGCTAEVGARYGASQRGPDADDPDSLVEMSQEQCGNAVDDDGDGSVDEDCGCELGQSRECYAGPAGTLGIGACHAGIQQCDDHFEFPSWGACVGATGPVDELPNGVDDDCDGFVDCSLGDECANDPCLLNPEDPVCLCPDGGTPTYRKNYGQQGFGGSSITDGDGGDAMTMSCEPTDCAAGEVGVVVTDPWLATTETRCAEPPPECPDGTSPDYRSGSAVFGDEGGERFPGGVPDGEGGVQEDHWVCSPPCDVIVQYGGLYGGLTVCTSPPNIACDDPSQTPTFVFETEQWECRPTCDNGLYDQINFEGGILCVPC